jgi:hypothetical protein
VFVFRSINVFSQLISRFPELFLQGFFGSACLPARQVSVFFAIYFKFFFSVSNFIFFVRALAKKQCVR